MPHLDASALSSDQEGLDFLRSVLDVPVDTPTPAFRFCFSVGPLSTQREPLVKLVGEPIRVPETV